MRQLTAYASYFDNLGALLVGRARFCNLDGSPAVVYGLDNATQQYVPIGSMVYTNSSGQFTPQVFLADHDYLIVFDKYIGGGTMSEDDDQESWEEQGSAIDRYNTVAITLNGGATRVFETIDVLRQTIPIDVPGEDKEIVTLLGYNEPGDKPSINYQWDAFSTDADNGGSVIKVDGVAVGRWRLVECPEYLDVRHFGAFPNVTSDEDAAQRYRIQLAGVYTHANQCGLYFWGNGTNQFYDVSGLELHGIDSDENAKVFCVDGLETSLTEVVHITCAADQDTPIASQGKIILYGDLLRTSFAPSYNAQFEPTRKIIVDANVDTSNLEIWDALVEVTVDTTSHWLFYNCQVESAYHIGDNVSFLGPTNLEESMFKSGTDFSTITVDDGVICDIDDFYNMANWCKLVKQQSAREFDIKGKTLDSNCNLNFSTDDVVTLINAHLSAFSCLKSLDLKNCEGTLKYPLNKTLRLYNCSEGIVISSINQNADVVSRFSNLQFTSDIIVSSLNAVGSIIYSSSNTLTVKNAAVATSTRILAELEAGDLVFTDCVITKDAAGDIVTLRGCTIDDSNVIAYAPYDGSNANLITVTVTGCKFLGSSKLKLKHTHASGDTSKPYDLSFNVCGNFSDHDFVDDSAFNGVTHTVTITKCVYKGNYGGCPTESGYGLTGITYSKETLSNSSPGECGAIPSAQADNTVVFYTDQRSSTVAGWAMNVYWWCLKVNGALTLASFNVFGFTYLNVKTSVRIRPKCVCTFKPGAPNDQTYGDNPIVIPMLVKTGSMNKSGYIAYQEDFAMDYGMATDVNIGQRERYMLTVVTGANLPAAAASIEWIVDQTGFEV